VVWMDSKSCSNTQPVSKCSSSGDGECLYSNGRLRAHDLSIGGITMNLKALAPIALGVIILAGCGSKEQQQAATPAQPGTAPPAAAGQPAPTQPASGQPAPGTVPEGGSTPPNTATAPSAAPPPPPAPKKYVVAAGTPIAVRTLSDVNTKNVKSGNEFEATLQGPLQVDGHTLAPSGASVIGVVTNADQGGRVKGKASLSLKLARLHLANGQTVAIHTNTVSQEAKSGTKKNLMRTGIASGAGAAIGAIAGGGRGAAIGAGIGAGAGVATNMATRGPAAEIPPETLLNFQLTSDLVVTGK
jgi:hypothetical protein